MLDYAEGKVHVELVDTDSTCVEPENRRLKYDAMRGVVAKSLSLLIADMPIWPYLKRLSNWLSSTHHDLVMTAALCIGNQARSGTLEYV